MLYDVHSTSEGGFFFETHRRARRGRGVLFATAPLTLYLFALGLGFLLAVNDLSLWPTLRQGAGWGGLVALGLSASGFLMGRRIRDRIEVSRSGLVLRRRPALGPERVEKMDHRELTGFAVEPSLRSLGADLLLVAVRRDGTRAPIVEGEPHSGQLREIAAALANTAGLPLQP